MSALERLLVGRDPYAAVFGVVGALGTFALVAAAVGQFVYFTPGPATALLTHWAFRPIAGLGLLAAAVYAYGNDGLLVSCLLALAPVGAFVLLKATVDLSGVSMAAVGHVQVAAVAGCVLGVAGFVLGAGLAWIRRRVSNWLTARGRDAGTVGEGRETTPEWRR